MHITHTHTHTYIYMCILYMYSHICRCLLSCAALWEAVLCSQCLPTVNRFSVSSLHFQPEWLPKFWPLMPTLPRYDCTIKSWLWLISVFGISFAWTGSLAWATASSRPHSDVFDCNDIFKASCSKLPSQQGCVLSWRGRQHRVDVIPSSVENSWDSKTNSWSFHPTSFDPFWKGWRFPLSFQLSERKGWAHASAVAAGPSTTALHPPVSAWRGRSALGAERKPSTSARWSRSQWLLLLMAHVWLYLLNLVKQETGFEARGSWRVQAPAFKCSYKMHNWHQLTGNI